MEKEATKVMPLPTLLRQSNSLDGNNRESGMRASRAKNSANPASPTASSSEERMTSIDRPAPAISITATTRQPSGRNGKGGGFIMKRRSMVAAEPVSTARLAAAMATPAVENRPNAQRQDSSSAAIAPNSGPAKAATPQIADIMAKSC